VVSVAAIVAVAFDAEGRRQIVGLHISPSEAEIFWAAFLKSLGKRGLRGLKLEAATAGPNRRLATQPVAGIVSPCPASEPVKQVGGAADGRGLGVPEDPPFPPRSGAGAPRRLGWSSAAPSGARECDVGLSDAAPVVAVDAIGLEAPHVSAYFRMSPGKA
jgi:hypothetical protein